MEAKPPLFIKGRLSENDGRLQRSSKMRLAVTRAMLDLIRETGAVPTMDAVADRANVSRRSVFRHFPETITLLIAAAGLQRDDVAARFPARDTARLPLQERVRSVAQRTGRINEYVAPLRALADPLRAEHPVIDTLLRDEQDTYAHHFTEIFADVLAHVREAADGAVLMRAMVSAVGWGTWRSLRRDQFLTVLEARKVVEHTLSALLTAVRSEPS